MDQHRVGQVVFIEGLVEIRQDHHGEFQALGFVDAHEAHAAAHVPRAGRRSLAPVQQAAQMGDEIEQAALPPCRHG